ncbi:MAG: hypothetical protein B7Y59_02105 [Burkholderiales bacterium 35-55-47]|jgi:hypothetical protein|uniref:hypothetical protein n=1 Tax=Limnohabitans sp. TaxID=1907725 RepID=UPI000BDD73B7|nr:hypothetical protein [Limnohabitans sp.]OYY19916.1 MAG: hypothetical protein B7Y59_02105 [Burkholderiales bacterium 35-55-47]OYZ74473.1 MAG: hypothetical protein B7Y06_02905 [Burkholderiales bacterium 24-55-52]OZB01637.1 MAG: hypothetical protein B7X62_02100 [Burkholderiales bacterium 39-55-53]HQR86130.1 hypothetical protein [Limnohabitans sp.]HQS25954.1 hypothetical protein [Limnohabitans sp.]
MNVSNTQYIHLAKDVYTFIRAETKSVRWTYLATADKLVTQIELGQSIKVNRALTFIQSNAR